MTIGLSLSAVNLSRNGTDLAQHLSTRFVNNPDETRTQDAFVWGTPEHRILPRIAKAGGSHDAQPIRVVSGMQIRSGVLFSG